MAWRSAEVFGLCLLVAACNGDPGALTGRTSPVAESRPGTSSDFRLPSNVDGEAIAFTVHEPDHFVEGAKYPLIVATHGFAQKRYAAAQRGDMLPEFKLMLAAGYGIVMPDLRGHGDSGGLAHAADPAFEGKDLLQVLDWVEANVPWLMYRDGNVVLGAYGASYGGGMMHMLHAIDPKRRVDAMAIAISWHDLRYSFYDGDTFKSQWGENLGALAIQTGTRLHPQLAQILSEGVSVNHLSADELDFLYRASPVAACDAGLLTPVDVFYIQSTIDTLFPLQEATANVACYRALGGDVRFWGIPQGHAGGEHNRCGLRESSAAMVAWFDEKLKGIPGAAYAIPELCLNLNYKGSDAVLPDSFVTGSSPPYAVPQQSLTLFTQDATEIDVPLVTIGPAGDVFAGTPTLELDVLDPQLGENGAGDPILFAGIGLVRAGGPLEIVNNLRPFRGYGHFSAKLNADTLRLAAGDVIKLRLRAGQITVYQGNGSRAPTPITVQGSVRLPLLGPLPSSPG